MPLYLYDCQSCKKQFEIRHSYGEKDIKCSFCNSINIKKNLSGVLQVTKKCYNIKEKTGSQVKKAIEEGKEELEQFKKTKKNRIIKTKK
tara:strand:+ start:145 stop:411 length:267 start_codon:yes stop_codon:yes gene_type:complete